MAQSPYPNAHFMGDLDPLFPDLHRQIGIVNYQAPKIALRSTALPLIELLAGCLKTLVNGLEGVLIDSVISKRLKPTTQRALLKRRACANIHTVVLNAIAIKREITS
jgi:hypothetical protein